MSETDTGPAGQNQNENVAKILRMIENAEISLNAAKELLAEVSPEAAAQAASTGNRSTVTSKDATAYDEGPTQIVEGRFDGQNMIGPSDKIFPVPANYASKSKLIQGDKLKLTIQPNGSFLYKQIAPTARKFIKGTLINEDGHYKVLAEDKSYKVILASVTYYKGTVGDEVTLVVPENGESDWAAIEAIIPQVSVGNYDKEKSF